VRFTSRLTIDPCGHCQQAADYFTQDLVAGRTALAVMQAFELYGIRPVNRTDILNITFYVLSSNDEAGLNVGQYWTSLEEFPTPTMTKYFAHSDGSATTIPPQRGNPSDSREFTSYVYDPSNPVPTVGGSNLDMPCGPLDQAEIDTRSDVLIFQTPVFDTLLAMTGPIFADLYVGSDCIDTDFVVRMSDVYPTGEVRLIQDSNFRMRCFYIYS
jgi:putative CocE/NonD family hydrolase